MKEAAREGEIQRLRGELSIVRQENTRLELENRALAARAALAVTQEANVREVERIRDVALQECYRCSHVPTAPDPGCPCCKDDHTPDPDGHFSSATAEEFAELMEKMHA